MPALRDVQSMFRRALLQKDPGAAEQLVALIAGGEFSPSERIAVYRNNVFASLTDALKETFPVIRRLVGDGFFDFAAHEFVASRPPTRPSLAEYGGAFADFLAEFPPCREFVYLADVARLEWAMNEAANAPDATSASPDVLVDFGPEVASKLEFRLHPSYRYVASPFPIDRIWRANQSDACDETISLDAGGVQLEVSRQSAHVGFRPLDDASFIFRETLAQGQSLGVALGSAFAATSEFAAGDALAALFHEGAVVAITQSVSEEDHAS